MKKTACALFVLLAVTSASADEKSIYVELLQNNRLDELVTHLQSWIKREPGNPEVYIAFFNYFIRLDSESFIALRQDDLTNQYVLGSQTRYNEANVLSALEYLDRGLAIAPDRLDMHFGKIRMLQEIHDFKNQGIALITVLRLSKTNKNAWLWADNKPLVDGENVFLLTIQDYFMAWYNSGTKEALEVFYNCASVEIELYPGTVYGYNNLALYYNKNKNYKAALECLLKAEAVNPGDYIVINNIAHCYIELGQRAKAKEYFEKLLQFPEKVDPEYVRKKIESL